VHIDQKEEQGIVILAPEGRLDSNTSHLLDQAIENVGSGEDGFHVLVDFSAVEYISSAGLRVVLKALKQRQAGPKYFAASSMQDHVREVFEISGFDAYIPIHENTTLAITSLT
jgi:anti-anti-sigma factor